MAFLGRVVILAFTFIFSVVAIFNTSNLPMFDSQGLPSARFWPIVCAILVLILFVVNVIELIRQLKSIDKKIKFKEMIRAGLFYVFLFVMAVFISNYLGFFTSMAIFLFISLLVWNELPWTTCLPVSLGLPLVMWFICAYILKMAQFPQGILF